MPTLIERQLLAEAAAHRAGRDLLRRWTLPAEGVGNKSSRASDIVSDADRAAEALIVETLSANGEECRWWGEETGETGRGGWRWVIDPLDGTYSYLRGLPSWCVSIGGEDLDDPSVGVVYAPVTGDLYSAHRGGECLHNGIAVDPQWASTVSEASMAVMGSSHSHWLLPRLWGNVGPIWAPGALALTLANLAVGRYDIVHYVGMFEWYDAAAGVVLAEAAGCEVMVRGFETSGPSEIIAVPAHLADEYRALMPDGHGTDIPVGQ